MIESQHICAWTRQKRTDLLLGRGNQLFSAGVDLSVLLSAWAEPDLTWYSVIYGEQADDIDIVATTDEFDVEPHTREVAVEAGPVTRSIGAIFPVREYILNDLIARKLGLFYTTHLQDGMRTRDNDYPQELPKGVCYFIYSHDECLINISPCNDALISRTLARVLEVHSFYLQHDFDWSPILEQLIDLFRVHDAIRLRSHEARGRNEPIVNIGLPPDSWTAINRESLHRSPKFKLAWRIKFDEGIAHMESIK